MQQRYLALIFTLPIAHSSARVRLWRGLKAMGCALLRDGVYLVPESPQQQSSQQPESTDALARLTMWQQEVEQASGSAAVFYLEPTQMASAARLRQLFDRSELYQLLDGRIDQFLNELTAIRTPPDRVLLPQLQKTMRALKRELTTITAIDFFPGPHQQQTMSAAEQVQRLLTELFSDDEPHAVTSAVPVLDRGQYQHRLWATRKRLWVDRIASAWLIRRFIDSHATFLWLDHPDDCPATALGFDFDGAPFSHNGLMVTFETLLASFALRPDPALRRMAALVRYLDTGSPSSAALVAEATGVEIIMTGLRQQFQSNDDQLLQSASALLDALYTAFSPPTTQPEELIDG
ncbi:MAG: chromate resistance protein [Magnetococcales bacterium]|nr:chromate resistance protein [Magnetococcales bacterium]